MKRELGFITGAVLLSCAVLFVGRSHDRHVHAAGQTPANVCAAGQFINSELVNTGSSCGAPAAFVPPTSWWVNGMQQSGTVKCGWATGTSSGAGLITFNPSTALGGITAIIGQPIALVTGAASSTSTASLQTGYTATSATVFVQTATIISVAGISVSLFSNAALPTALYVCGK